MIRNWPQPYQHWRAKTAWKGGPLISTASPGSFHTMSWLWVHTSYSQNISWASAVRTIWAYMKVEKYWIFQEEKFVFALISIFSKLWMQMRKRRLQKTENLFYKYVLEFNYATINGLLHPRCYDRCTYCPPVQYLNRQEPYAELFRACFVHQIDSSAKRHL